MSANKKKFVVRRSPVIVDVGCSCRKTKLSSFFFSTKPKKLHAYFSPSTSTTTTTTTTAATSVANSSSSFSFHDSPQRPRRQPKKKQGRLVGESVAVEKESSEPYLDFRESMVQMIVENEIYGWDDLRELLHRLLSLNSPEYHPLILRAFSDVCHAVFSPPSR